MIATIANNPLIPTLLVSGGSFLAGAGLFLRQVLPLLSDRVNDRAVRLLKAKKKSK